MKYWSYSDQRSDLDKEYFDSADEDGFLEGLDPLLDLVEDAEDLDDDIWEPPLPSKRPCRSWSSPPKCKIFCPKCQFAFCFLVERDCFKDYHKLR
ncbi:hypothetical protein J4Q44_G00090210 [Coregonus suidteri]|uniref:Uncharacterized protein n=1 Tax=Coregonus suidteri TaxID=861788 RepID=A0AAN8M1J7_9TELE